MIQHEFITLSLVQFDQILRIPNNGQAVFTNKWDLVSLAYSQETEGPYHTDLPTPDDIRQFLQLDRVELNRTIKSQNDTLTPNQILTKELRQDMKRWEELIYENVFRLGGHRDHLLARDDDEDNGASRASTSSPTTYLNSLRPLNYQRYDIPTSSQQDDVLLFERQTILLNQS
ncbi:hypothetical protein Tco_1178230 [Tanacetum coccineum]